MSAVLQVENLYKRYPNIQVLQGLSFRVNQGEVYGLLGQNGAGKSTAIDCILGLKKYDSGSLRLLEHSPGDLKHTVFKEIGVQFQQSHFQDKIKVEELCRLTASYYKKPLDYRPLLVSFGILGKEKQNVENLSGGEKQKLSVLLTLLPNPKIIFLDELTTGMDTKARRQVWKQLLELKGKGLTILLTSHYMDEVEALCDRIGIIAQGRILVTGTVPEVIAQSGQSSLEEAYLWYTGEEEDENI